MAKRGGKRSTSFKPGQSGNPGGRPKIVAEVKELARQYTEEAVVTLVNIMQSAKAPPAARVSAASVILDRGYGKAPQHITAEISLFDRMTLDERYALDAALAAISGGAGDAEGGEPATHH